MCEREGERKTETETEEERKKRGDRDRVGGRDYYLHTSASCSPDAVALVGFVFGVVGVVVVGRWNGLK